MNAMIIDLREANDIQAVKKQALQKNLDETLVAPSSIKNGIDKMNLNAMIGAAKKQVQDQGYKVPQGVKSNNNNNIISSTTSQNQQKRTSSIFAKLKRLEQGRQNVSSNASSALNSTALGEVPDLLESFENDLDGIIEKDEVEATKNEQVESNNADRNKKANVNSKSNMQAIDAVSIPRLKKIKEKEVESPDSIDTVHLVSIHQLESKIITLPAYIWIILLAL